MNTDTKEKCSTNESSHDYLYPLTIMGRILLFTPLLFGLLSISYSLLTKNDSGLIYEGDPYSAALLFLCGLITLLYVAVKRFKQGLKG